MQDQQQQLGGRDIRKLIAEVVQRETGTVIGVDDPIQWIPKINSQIFASLQQDHQEMMNRFEREMLKAIRGIFADADRRTNTQLKNFGEVTENIFSENISALDDTIRASVQSTVDEAIKRVEERMVSSQRISVINMTVCVVSFITVCIALWVSIVRH